jgi:hypothetical protein
MFSYRVGWSRDVKLVVIDWIWEHWGCLTSWWHALQHDQSGQGPWLHDMLCYLRQGRLLLQLGSLWRLLAALYWHRCESGI